ncbi:RbsD or FucU transport [Bifidobacterium margollesii]|uniref:RbsD or FucU transport n=1 Tax=Bifidobacterium margollesii TaxID=2020964 RepID=A0A2N5JAT1_9BIFI|nr:RbsD/FucU family protein [Bifidobacterium margollesii]PLS31281.1 RbsD or FucU transport [Bifidobacterium margollesii]
MLTSSLIHPQIAGALAACGHGDKVLIADGNYPLGTAVNPNAERVYLALRAGQPTVTDVLETLLGEINVERAAVMTPGDSEPEPPIFDEFRSLLGFEELDEVDRFSFYEEAKGSPNLVLAINTGETRTFANVLLTVGVRDR